VGWIGTANDEASTQNRRVTVSRIPRVSQYHRAAWAANDMTELTTTSSRPVAAGACATPRLGALKNASAISLHAAIETSCHGQSPRSSSS
jgi:hypothetical protein